MSKRKIEINPLLFKRVFIIISEHFSDINRKMKPKRNNLA